MLRVSSSFRGGGVWAVVGRLENLICGTLLIRFSFEESSALGTLWSASRQHTHSHVHVTIVKGHPFRQGMSRTTTTTTTFLSHTPSWHIVRFESDFLRKRAPQSGLIAIFCAILPTHTVTRHSRTVPHTHISHITCAICARAHRETPKPGCNPHISA